MTPSIMSGVFGWFFSSPQVLEMVFFTGSIVALVMGILGVIGVTMGRD